MSNSECRCYWGFHNDQCDKNYQNTANMQPKHGKRRIQNKNYPNYQNYQNYQNDEYYRKTTIMVSTMQTIETILDELWSHNQLHFHTSSHHYHY